MRLALILLAGCFGDLSDKDDSATDTGAASDCYEVSGSCPDACFDVSSDRAYFRAVWQCGAPDNDPTDPGADCAPAEERLWGFEDGTAQLCAYCSTDLESVAVAYTFLKGTICDPDVSPVVSPAVRSGVDVP